MAFDYTFFDLRKHFTIDDAAIAWCEIMDRAECRKMPFLQMRGALLQAVQEGQIEADIPEKIVERRIRGCLYDMSEPEYEKALIPRENLKAWAITLSQKPKFLFPEMRQKPESEKIVPVKDKPEPKAKQKNELHALFEKIYVVLRAELRRPPDAEEMLSAVRNRKIEFDESEIVQTVKDRCIFWLPTNGKNIREMGKKALQNRIGELKIQYGDQLVVKKIPA
jgi:hypothetical protein